VKGPVFEEYEDIYICTKKERVRNGAFFGVLVGASTQWNLGDGALGGIVSDQLSWEIHTFR
jgi:hypothetical protein